MTTDIRDSSRLRLRDVPRVGSVGLRSRPTRSVLSALGIAIGIAAMIATVGLSASSQARLDADLARLGTNLLRASAGSDFTGGETTLPSDAAGKVELIDGVQRAAGIATLPASVYRSALSDPEATGGITTTVVQRNLLSVVQGSLRVGSWLDAATERYPTVVLGATAAARLGIVTAGTQIWLGGQLFTVLGILEPVPLAPELNAAAMVGTDVARMRLGFTGGLDAVYERSSDDSVERVRSLLAATISPRAPDTVDVSRPSDALAAKRAAEKTFNGLLLGLGAVALLVGGIGIANTMIISVIERRREIGLRRALGARRLHVMVQFLTEALTLSAFGGLAGCALGAGVTAVVASANDWPFAMPVAALVIAVTATLVIGAVAGLYPAARAARIPPTAALSA